METIIDNPLTNCGSRSPSVYVVIPNKNGRSHLSYSLPSLFGTNYDNYRVVLVDDGSTDESAGYVRRDYRDVTILNNSGKTGFAGAVNTGIRHALSSNAAYIAIFNSDIKVLPEWLNMILPIFAREQNAGLVGFAEITKEREELFYNSTVNVTDVVYKNVPRLAGCLYICPAAAFKRIGLFDEDYFMYGEDNDFFYRLKAAGFKLLETNVPVWHYGEGSSQNNKLLPTWLAYRNALRFSIKNEGLLGALRMILALANQGCNPFLRQPADHPVFRRMRRYNPVFNILLILGSCVWNLRHLGSTLKSRVVRI